MDCCGTPSGITTWRRLKGTIGTPTWSRTYLSSNKSCKMTICTSNALHYREGETNHTYDINVTNEKHRNILTNCWTVSNLLSFVLADPKESNKRASMDIMSMWHKNQWILSSLIGIKIYNKCTKVISVSLHIYIYIKM